MSKPYGVYVRISTAEQNTAGQVAELQGWLSRQGISPDSVEWYTDTDSGEKIKREALGRLQADIHAGRVKTVVFWKTDRLSRDWLHGLTLCCEWAAKGVRVISTTQPIDLSGPMGQAMAGVFFAFGQMETETRRERQAAGIREAKKRGVYKGRKPGTLKASPERARELRAKGLQVAEVATALGCSLRTACRYLSESPDAKAVA